MNTDNRYIINLLHALNAGNADKTQMLLEQADGNTESLSELLRRYKLSGYCYVLARENNLLKLFSDAVISELKSEYDRQESRCEKLLEFLFELDDQLSAGGISFLLMKGFYLSIHFVGGMSWRQMYDIDLLVQTRDLEAAISSVQSVGLKHMSRMPLDPRNPKWGLHAVELTGGRFRKLDLHCTFRNILGVNFDYERIWGDSQTFEIQGRKFRILGDRDLLVMLMLGVATDIQCGHHKLRKLWEIYLVLRKLDSTLDWQAFFNERSREGTLKLMLNIFALCIYFLGVSEDCPILSQAINKQDMILIKDRQAAEKIFARGKQNPLNRLFFSRLLPVSAQRYWLWWLFVYVPARFWNRRKALATF